MLDKQLKARIFPQLTIEEIAASHNGAIKIGPFGSQLKKEDLSKQGYKVYGQENIIESDFSIGDRWISVSKFSSLKSCRLFPDDIVLTMMGTIGKCLIFPKNAATGIMDSHLLRIQINREIADNRFVAIMIAAEEVVGRQIAQRSHGSIMSGLSSTIVRRLSLPLPPLPEQRRIAEILDTADEAIRQTESLLAKLKQVKAGLLHDLLTRGLDAHGQLRDPLAHPEQFKDSPLGRIPKEWEAGNLLSNVSLPNGQIDPKREPYCNWPLIAPDHIEANTGRLINIQTAAEQNAISGKYSFQSGDVLYSKIRPYLRKAILVECEGLCSADMYPLKPHPTIVPRFLLAVVLGEHFSRFATAVSMRSGFPKINREELGEYHFALPKHQEQEQIVEVLNSQDVRIRNEEIYLEKLKQVKKGLMEDLLSGRVRVDPGETGQLVELAGVGKGTN